MPRPEGTNQCKHVDEKGTRCERGTLSEYCRRHRKQLGLQNDGTPVPTELKVSLDEISEQVGRHVWEAAVEAALDKKRQPAPAAPQVKKGKKAA